MKRGDLWTAAGGSAYSAKPRSVVILQDDRFDSTSSITVCPLTSDPDDLPLFRIGVEPDSANGLRAASRVMVDKITSIPRARMGMRIGRLSDADMVRLNRAVVVFLGIAGG